MEDFNYGSLISRASIVVLYAILEEEKKKLKTPTMIIDSCSK